MSRGVQTLFTGLLCVSMTLSGVVTGHEPKASLTQAAQAQYPTDSMQSVSALVNKYLTMDVSRYTPAQYQSSRHLFSDPLLGGNEIFGLWVTIRYNGKEVSQKIDIKRWMILGKLGDPNYRTPIRFNLDDDPADDVETGFGFYRYGIDEITDSGTVNHKAWATSFDFRQINNGLANQTTELEVWQEFHVNLHLITSLGPFTLLKAILTNILLRLQERLNHPSLPLLEKIEDSLAQPVTLEPGQASQDYIVLRVGYRSPAGEKIPVHIEKTFAVSKENLFHPAIFQHEMDSNDIIGTASNDFLFGFQSYKAGQTDPAYNVEFAVNFDPACNVVTQLTPLSGKTFFYYHTASDEPTNITFYSNLLAGGTTAEQENATFTFTLSLASVPLSLVGPGKWMSFDLNRRGDLSPFDGSFSYRASTKFNVGMILSSPWFKEKLQLNGIPTQADLTWALNASFHVAQGKLFEVETLGFINTQMDDNLDQIAVYYPKNDTQTPDVAWLTINAIPSSRRIDAGASLLITNSSMLILTVDGFVGHSMSSSLGAVTMYYPKPDPGSDPDMPFVSIPAGSLAGSGQIQVSGTLYVDPDPDNFWVNPDNYLSAFADRTASSNFGEAAMYLPGVEEPMLTVDDVPSNAYGSGQFWWNQPQGHLYAERSSAGNPDPIKLSLTFDNLSISDELRIGNGAIDVQGLIATDGFFSLDTTNDMLDDRFEIKNLATGKALMIEAGTVSATDFAADWVLNVTGPQPQIQTLDLSGHLNAFDDFHVALEYNGDQLDFTGNWSLGDTGSVNLDFTQTHPIHLGFNLDDAIQDIDFHGGLTLASTLHFDMSWRWDQGSYTDPSYFRINQNCSHPNLQAINLYFTYGDQWGANVTLSGVALYVCVEWYWQNLHLYIWPVFSVTGNLDFNLLLAGTWHYHVEDGL